MAMTAGHPLQNLQFSLMIILMRRPVREPNYLSLVISHHAAKRSSFHDFLSPLAGRAVVACIHAMGAT